MVAFGVLACAGEPATLSVVRGPDGGGADAGTLDGGRRDGGDVHLRDGGQRDGGRRDGGSFDAGVRLRDGGVTFLGSLLLADDAERRIRHVGLDGQELGRFDVPLESVGGVAYDASRRTVWVIAATQASPLLASWPLDGGPTVTYAPPQWVPPEQIGALSFALNLSAGSDALVFLDLARGGAGFRIWRIDDQRYTFASALPRNRGFGLELIEYRWADDGYFVELWSSGDAALARASVSSAEPRVTYSAAIPIEPAEVGGIALLPGGFAIIDAARRSIGLHDEQGRRITSWLAPGTSIVDVAHVED